MTATLPVRAVGFDDPKGQQSPAGSPDLDAAKQQAKQIDDEIIITKKLPPKEEKPAEGPPSKDKLIMDEARERLEWLKTMQNQAHEAITQAEHAKNPAEAKVLSKDARLKAEARISHRLGIGYQIRFCFPVAGIFTCLVNTIYVFGFRPKFPLTGNFTGNFWSVSRVKSRYPSINTGANGFQPAIVTGNEQGNNGKITGEMR